MCTGKTTPAASLRTLKVHGNGPGLATGIFPVPVTAARKGYPAGIHRFNLHWIRMYSRLFFSLLRKADQHDHTDEYGCNTGNTQDNPYPLCNR